MKNHLGKQHFETPSALRHDAHTLAEDAEALLEATKEIVDDKIKAARKQLAETIESSRELSQAFRTRRCKAPGWPTKPSTNILIRQRLSLWESVRCLASCSAAAIKALEFRASGFEQLKRQSETEHPMDPGRET